MKIKLGLSTLESRENPSATGVDPLVLTAPVADLSATTQNYFGAADTAPVTPPVAPPRDIEKEQIDALLRALKIQNALPGGPDFVGPPLPPSLGGPYPFCLPPLLEPNPFGGPPVPVGTTMVPVPPSRPVPPIVPRDGIPLGPIGY